MTTSRKKFKHKRPTAQKTNNLRVAETHVLELKFVNGKAKDTVSKVVNWIKRLTVSTGIKKGNERNF